MKTQLESVEFRIHRKVTVAHSFLVERESRIVCWRLAFEIPSALRLPLSTAPARQVMLTLWRWAFCALCGRRTEERSSERSQQRSQQRSHCARSSYSEGHGLFARDVNFSTFFLCTIFCIFLFLFLFLKKFCCTIVLKKPCSNRGRVV